MLPRQRASVLGAVLVAALAIPLGATPAARAQPRGACGARLSTALSGLAAAARDADAVTAAARFADDADRHGFRALARLALEVEASARAAEAASLHRAVAALIDPPARVSITGACAAAT
ncbi:MAG: hypothetical protein JNK64_31430 [Myxococcales bacterium]|nr:hypothetical protein [Myxococcales bacterium]